MSPAPSAGFRRVIAAEVVSNFGSMMSRLAIPWLAVLALGATPWQMGLLAVADVPAGATAAVGIGVLVDRWPKRAAMVAADVARAALLVGLAASPGALFQWAGGLMALMRDAASYLASARRWHRDWAGASVAAACSLAWLAWRGEDQSSSRAIV